MKDDNSRSDNISLLMEFLSLYGSGAWTEMAMLFEPDAVYEDSSGSSVRGGELIAESMSGWKTAFPDAVASEVKTVVAEDDVVVVELTWAGTHSVALAPDKTLGTSDRQLEPTGNRVTTPAVIIAELKAGKIRKMRHYYDMLGFLRQLEEVVPS